MSALRFTEWFAPVDFNAFTRDYLGQGHLYCAPKPELAEHLSGLIGIRSAQDLCRLKDPKVLAWFQNPDGTHSSAPVSAESGCRLHEAGMTLFAREIVEFACFEREIEAQLGLPSRAASCAIFLNRPGAVTRAHFDTVETITVQLSGSKRWTVAPNTFAPFPLHNWVTLSAVPPELRRYAEAEPPAEIQGGATYVLEPGAVLHVPRGYWHETESDRDSVSLHIHIRPPLWLDLVVAAVKNELARDERWRRPAYILRGGEETVLETARSALAAARDAAGRRLDPRDLVGPGGPVPEVDDGSVFVRCGQAALGIDASDHATGLSRVAVATYEFKGVRVARMEMSPEFLRASRWVNNLPTGTVFDVSDVLHQAPELDLTAARDLLQQLERTGLVRSGAAAVRT